MNLRLVYTRSAVLLARSAAGVSSGALSSLPDLLTTLGPWSAAEVVDYLGDEHPELEPGAATQVPAFLASGAALRALVCRSPG